MKDKYTLEIYYPGKAHDVWVSFMSDTPFQAISKGDIINSSDFPDADAQSMLRVTSVEHVLWTLDTRESKHKVCVYTENIEDSQSARYGF